MNLIRNAMEAVAETENRQQGVLVETNHQDGAVVISVVDHGVGVAAEAVENLFSPFYSTKANGMGIGLSICQSIITNHGGQIGYKPNPRGGVFSILVYPQPSSPR
ncbi:ATP-binding protein [Oceanicoccus sp. KOV_DT_Chl]|uniref:ATP-binding protein n=1 Tax=Oceanicoccus sp. KOV_DT_Chl TaxID=1904639 RepID=UPI001F42DCB1|nr:ATP-binding protein [Oceanicoccus sp. KOV_DT_Chl]